ncbi:MAG TPA: type II secretion system F family protein [Candidatus Saccharimonadales bacterium]
MAKFSYKATDAAGKTLTGTIEAVDRNAALANLRKENLRPITLTLSGEKHQKSVTINSLLGQSRVKINDLVVFTRQLSTMVSAGVPILRALNTLQVQAESSALKSVLETVVKDVESGSALADAFAKHPSAFSDVYINMVRAGEAAGILDEILKRIASQQEKNASIRKKVKGAMTYPIILLIITFVAFFALMLFVIPQIGIILKDIGGADAELPVLTQVMLGISGFLQNQWYIVIGGIILIVVGVRRYLRSPRGKAQFHAVVLKIPGLGSIIQKVAVARFSRTFASMMGAGVNVLEALRVTGRAIGNVSYEKALEQAVVDVQNGKQLSQALMGNKLFPAIIPQMLAVGEETGQTDTVLVKVADFYEEEVDTAISSISSIIEPVMIVFMGGMIGLIAASVLGPISSLTTSIK